MRRPREAAQGRGFLFPSLHWHDVAPPALAERHPRIHELAALVEQIAAITGAFCLVADMVSQLSLPRTQNG